jgi:tetratricopeptide (TPR) repeat protein
MPSRTSPANLLASAALAVILALSAGGCSNIGARETISSVNAADTASPGSDEFRRSLETLGARYRQNPNDADVAIAYARALRATDQRAQAVAVLEQASIRNPRNMALLGAYGRALADVGQYQQALVTLERAHTPDNPDWRILNVQGAVLDQMAAMPKRKDTMPPRKRAPSRLPRGSPRRYQGRAGCRSQDRKRRRPFITAGLHDRCCGWTDEHFLFRCRR